MKPMCRILSVLLCLLFAAMLVTACGTADKTDEPDETVTRKNNNETETLAEIETVPTQPFVPGEIYVFRGKVSVMTPGGFYLGGEGNEVSCYDDYGNRIRFLSEAPADDGLFTEEAINEAYSKTLEGFTKIAGYCAFNYSENVKALVYTLDSQQNGKTVHESVYVYRFADETVTVSFASVSPEVQKTLGICSATLTVLE